MRKRITLLVAAAALALAACNGTGSSAVPSVPDLQSIAPEMSPAMSPEMSPETSPAMSPDESLAPSPS